MSTHIDHIQHLFSRFPINIELSITLYTVGKATYLVPVVIYIYTFLPGAGDGLSQYVHYFRADYTTKGMHLGMERKRESKKSCRRVQRATERDKQ